MVATNQYLTFIVAKCYEKPVNISSRIELSNVFDNGKIIAGYYRYSVKNIVKKT